MRTVVIGGFGHFGRRICRALALAPGIDAIAAGRSPPEHGADPGTETARLDIRAAGFDRDLAALRPDLVIHCAGPFQNQDYRVVRATLAAGAHYFDLADGRSFVSGFAAANDSAAKAAQRVALSGVSTLPALSTAVIDSLRPRLRTLEEIRVVIAPGQHAPRGRATVAAILGYAGRPFRWLSGGEWRVVRGWQALRRVHLVSGERWAAACDVPDLELLPVRYPGVQTVEFRAALEVGVLHFGLSALGMARRVGLPLEALAGILDRMVSLFDPFGGDTGGMIVSLVGRDHGGSRRRVEWELTAPENHGPEVPAMPATLLARRLAAGEAFQPGAFPCTGFLQLAEFHGEFTRLRIVTTIREDDVH